MIKVNTVTLEENASSLQNIESQVIDILYDISQVERELSCNHTVFEEEILAIQKQIDVVSEEKRKIRIMSQKLQLISKQYEQSERKIKDIDETPDAGKRKDSYPTMEVWRSGQINLTPTSVYYRNQPDQKNVFRQIWMSQWIVTEFRRNYQKNNFRWIRKKTPVLKKSRFTVQISNVVLNQKIHQLVQLLVK